MTVKLFTWEGIKVTIVHNLMLAGAVFTFVVIRVKFFGADFTF